MEEQPAISAYLAGRAQYTADKIAELSSIQEELAMSPTKRIVGQVVLFLVEVVCYCAFVTSGYFVVMAHRTPPLSMMVKIGEYVNQNPDIPSDQFLKLVAICYGVMVLTALLFLFLGLMAGRLRTKNGLIRSTEQRLQVLIEEFEEQKELLDKYGPNAISTSPSTTIFSSSGKVNEMPNPGF